MNFARLSRLSLLWKILLSTSIALTVLFAMTGWAVQEQFVRSATQSIEEEVRASFASYRSLWEARAGRLAAVSMVLSRMSDVRAAFGTGDRATIEDTAGEVWSKFAEEDAVFLVTDPRGLVLASLGGYPQQLLTFVPTAARRFPAQASGFLWEAGRLYQMVVTPVYVQSTDGPALLNVLVAGFVVNSGVARRLREAAGGSEFVFIVQGRVVASSLEEGLPEPFHPLRPVGGELPRVRVREADYALFTTPLLDIEGQPLGELRILRSFQSAERRLRMLRLNVLGIWLASMLGGLALTYALAGRILRPVAALDKAAAEIAQGNYNVRLDPGAQDELGRLARTFNSMCDSLQSTRQELIRQERLGTINRLSTSIVHDLRNPLAAIFAGSEILAEGGLPEPQVQRLAANIYRASSRIQQMLRELSRGWQGGSQPVSEVRLRELVENAAAAVAHEAALHRVTIEVNLPEDLSLSAEPERLGRVFENLLLNAVEAMPDGGHVTVSLLEDANNVVVAVEDTGPGIPPDLAPQLFQPFTSRKRNGMGLGLALSRQTVIDHGGDLALDADSARGARFLLRLPRG
jgi:signal transduction histidine kinase